MKLWTKTRKKRYACRKQTIGFLVTNYGEYFINYDGVLLLNTHVGIQLDGGTVRVRWNCVGTCDMLFGGVDVSVCIRVCTR